MFCIYGFFRKDTDESIYVGSCESFWKRFGLHIYVSATPNHRNYRKSKLYEYVNNNGGWDNIRYEILYKTDDDNINIFVKEREFYDKLNPICNTNRPFSSNEEKKIDKRDLQRHSPIIECNCGSSYKSCSKSKHVKTDKHQKYLQTL
jgi:hypothetical protein